MQNLEKNAPTRLTKGQHSRQRLQSAILPQGSIQSTSLPAVSTLLSWYLIAIFKKEREREKKKKQERQEGGREGGWEEEPGADPSRQRRKEREKRPLRRGAAVLRRRPPCRAERKKEKKNLGRQRRRKRKEGERKEGGGEGGGTRGQKPGNVPRNLTTRAQQNNRTKVRSRKRVSGTNDADGVGPNPPPRQTAVGTFFSSKNRKKNRNRLRFFVEQEKLQGSLGPRRKKHFWGPKSRCDFFTCIRQSQSQENRDTCRERKLNTNVF